MKHIFVGKWMPGMKHFLEYKMRSEVDEVARKRLKWLDYYFSHGEKLSLTCRYFGIARNTLYRWLRYYEPGALGSLKNHSTKPTVFRKRTVRPKIWNRVCELRMKYPAWGKEKLWVQLKREGFECSESSVGRILYEKGFPKARGKRKSTAHMKQTILRERRPEGLTLKHAGELIQMDSVIIQHNGKKIALVTAIDMATRVGFATLHRTTHAQAAWDTLVRFRELLGTPIKAVHTDNGSEFLGVFHEGCQREKIKHYFSKPRTPKNHAHVERFNGTLQDEGIQPIHLAMTTAEIREKLSEFLITYNLFRPHKSLRNLTPFEYYMRKQSPHSKSSPELFNMYWTSTMG